MHYEKRGLRLRIKEFSMRRARQTMSIAVGITGPCSEATRESWPACWEYKSRMIKLKGYDGDALKRVGWCADYDAYDENP